MKKNVNLTFVFLDVNTSGIYALQLLSPKFNFEEKIFEMLTNSRTINTYLNSTKHKIVRLINSINEKSSNTQFYILRN
jgi:hypothetical protein